MTLSEIQQVLFSYFNLTKVSSTESALSVFKEIINKLDIDKSPTSEQLKREVSEMNRIIQKYDFEIVDIADEITGEELYILVNTADNTVTQKSKFYDDSTTQLFSKIVKDCVLSEDGTVTETHCLNLTSQIKMSKTSAQLALEKLIADKWLVTVNNKISLGMRTIAELQQNIKQNYPDDVKNCNFCKLIAIQGYICDNCKLKYHFRCLKKYAMHTKSNIVCPNCKEVWNDLPDFIKMEDSQEFEDNPTPNNDPPKKRKKKSLI